jgi:N-acetylglucosaminyl-diphospho-decaprenol L-rhamnosyltransferase
MTGPHLAERMVDVVIPSYNNRDGLLQCLEHLTDPVIARRIVVDDVSSDGTPDAVRAAFPDVLVEEIEEHHGVSRAVNLGVAAGDAPYVLVLNDDILPAAGSVSGLVAALRAHPEASCAAGRLVDAGTGGTQDAYRPRTFPTVRTLAARLSGFERMRPGNRWSGQHLREALPESGVMTTPQQPPGACILFRRDQFDAIRGWDEDYWFYYEDTDFARRLSRFGPLLWVADATFEHVGMRSLGLYRRDQRHARLHFGTLVYAQRHFSRLDASLVGLMMVAVSIPRLIWVGIRRRPGAANYRWLIGAALSVIKGKPITLRIPAGEVRRRPAEPQFAVASR